MSVVIPAYNSNALIVRCLESLEKQTADKSSFEVIVVNDGSTDNTAATLRAYAENSSLHLHVLNLPHSGPAIARNHAVSHAKSEWIAFLDADMIACPTWVNRGLDLITQFPEKGGFEGRTEINHKEQVTPFTHQTSNLNGGRYPTCNLIIRKQLCHFYPGYRIPFREDTDLAFSVLKSGYEIIFDHELLAFHPPLPASYLRPIRLAMRYYYDGLLERRFPERYKNDVDVHYLMGIRIPHLRKKIYQAFAVSQIVALLGIFLPNVSSSVLLAVGGLHLVLYLMIFLIHIKSSVLSQISYRDLTIISFIAYIVPWIMLIQCWRGHLAFKNHPPFTHGPMLDHPDMVLSGTDPKIIPLRYSSKKKIKQAASFPLSVPMAD